MSEKFRVDRIVLNSQGIDRFLKSPELRATLEQPAQDLLAAIPPSDGRPGATPEKGAKNAVVNGRYSRKRIDRKATGVGDGRVAIHVGVEDADVGFFRMMTLQRALRSLIGGG